MRTVQGTVRYDGTHGTRYARYAVRPNYVNEWSDRPDSKLDYPGVMDSAESSIWYLWIVRIFGICYYLGADTK